MHNIQDVHCMALRKLRTSQGPLAFAAVFAMSYCESPIRKSLGPVMVPVVGHQLVASDAQFKSQGGPHDTCGRNSNTALS